MRSTAGRLGPFGTQRTPPDPFMGFLKGKPFTPTRRPNLRPVTPRRSLQFSLHVSIWVHPPLISSSYLFTTQYNTTTMHSPHVSLLPIPISSATGHGTTISPGERLVPWCSCRSYLRTAATLARLLPLPRIRGVVWRAAAAMVCFVTGGVAR